MADANGSPGPSTDRHNAPVVDPSRNVLDLVEAAVERLDDLGKKESKHVRQIMALHASHSKELREAEAHRIDAIRQVDVAASQQASKDAEIRATALANTVAASAEAMRVQVQATETAHSTTLTNALVPIQEAVADLRRVQYEQQGIRTQVQEGRAVVQEGRAEVQEVRSGSAHIGMWLGIAFGALGVLLSIASVVAVVVSIR